MNVPQASPPASRVIAEHPPAEIVEKRDDHTRVWEIAREVETTHPDGSSTVDTVKSYIHEKASGLCYKDATGSYMPSVAAWRETPDGFVIDRRPYRLVMGKTIGTSARYAVEGNDLLLRPAHLIISDGVSQAAPRPLTPQTPGSISPDNPSILRFPSAFGDGYDLEYVGEWGGFGVGRGNMTGPWGLALDGQGRLYVVDEGNDRIQVFDNDGRFICKWGCEGQENGQFKDPLCIAVHDATDDYKLVYVTDWHNWRIQKFEFSPTTLDLQHQLSWGHKVGWVTFTGTGLNDMDSGGSYTQPGRRPYRVQIDGIGSPDTFKWSEDGGATWNETGVPIPASAWPLWYGITVTFGDTEGHMLGDRWDFTASHEAARLDDEFVELRGIDCDEDGNIWVLDMGTYGDLSFIKMFNPDGGLLFKKLLDFTVEGPSLGHGLSYRSGNLYTGSGDLERDGLIFNKYDTSGNWVGHWGVRGSGPQESFCCWGVDVPPVQDPTMITTDWFCGRLQEWTLDGAWIRTIQNHLRSDAQSFKCKNKGSASQAVYQSVHLEAGSYTLQFLAFTNGQQVTDADVEPYAQGAQINSTDYDDYVLTTLKTTPEHYMWASRVSASFTVGTSASYDIGAKVKSGKTVHIASLTCFRN